MGQIYKVSKAFQSTDKETKQPQVIKTQGGDMHKYMVQVDGQPVPGWISILKKPGNAINVGDELYGSITENNWGKPQFNREQRPDGYTPSSKAQPSQAPVGNSRLEEKIDYLTVLVESMAGKKQDVTPTEVDDEPVDLSQLDY